MSDTVFNMVFDGYATLGIAPGATDAQIRAAFRQAVMRWHPDKNGGSREAQEKTIRAKEACDLLSDPARRRAHDARIEAASAPAVASEAVRPSGGVLDFLRRTLAAWAGAAKSYGKVGHQLALRPDPRPQTQVAVYGHFVLS